MRYASYRHPDGRTSFGRVKGDVIADLGKTSGLDGLADALAAGDLSALPDGEAVPLDAVTLLPVIPSPGKILCVGLNYASHIAEMGREQKGYPAIFTRWGDTLVAHGAALIKPSASDCLDFEGELAVVIGKTARDVSAERAMDHVAGFSIFNDASVRDWQRHNSQFTPGKNFPGTGGFGPFLVTPDEVDDLGSQRVQTRLNGQIVQDQPVSDMIWDVPSLIAYCSTFTELRPGDVISTGTPGGVGEGRKPPLYMKAGDQVEVSIGVLGTLSNTVAAQG